MVETENETKPEVQGSQSSAVAGCGVAMGSCSRQGAARRANARAAAASEPAAALKQETIHFAR
eukprot:1731506-Pyramimonas_sp.AAC.1